MLVIAGLDPAIHRLTKKMDARIKHVLEPAKSRTRVSRHGVMM